MADVVAIAGRGRARGRSRFMPPPSVASIVSVGSDGSVSGIGSIPSPALSTFSGSSGDTGAGLNPIYSDEVASSYSSGSSFAPGEKGRTPETNYVPCAAVVKTIKDGFSKVGLEGTEVNVTTNYYPMNKAPDFKLYQFRVDFIPIEDSTRVKKALMRQHVPSLGKFVFDGSVMYRSRLIPPELETLEATSETDDTKYTIKIKLVGVVNREDSMYLQFYNIVMRKCMTILGMEELGRNLYDPKAAIKFPDDRLQLWPGFATAIRTHEDGVLLCVEVTHKVLRSATVLDVIYGCKRPGMTPEDFDRAVRCEVEDSIVMTHYNRRTYAVSDIDFQATPLSEFVGQDGKRETYAAYFLRRHGIKLEEDELRQPMLVIKPKKRDINKGITGDIYLVPSLCNPTGLSDEMRKNFNLMKRLSTHLHMDPLARKRKLDEFMGKMATNPEVQKELAAWDVSFGITPLDAKARVFKQQEIVLGPDPTKPVLADPKGDWTRVMKNRRMLEPIALNKWILFYPPSDRARVDNFLVTLRTQARELGIHMADPEKIPYEVNKMDVRILEQKIRPMAQDLDLVFFVLPNTQLRRYSDVKHYTSLKLGVPSQCYTSRNLDNKNLSSICSKVMIQVTAKMGGVPWSIKVPLKKLMVLGFDVYHCSGRKGESAGALVGTNSPALTTYTSLVSFHKDKSELAQNLCEDFRIILKEYRRLNAGDLPDRIVMFRDGVGEGQVPFVLAHEVEQMKLAIRDMYQDAGLTIPKLSFLIVTKKINTRAFLRGRDNLQVGTVIDTVITLPERYDFFLVSQDVRQGTVSPSNYHVVYDESEMRADRMQLLSYKMCHLYYNWSGTVAVPATCQYAHKLAYLTGVAVLDKAKPTLQNKLWYL